MMKHWTRIALTFVLLVAAAACGGAAGPAGPGNGDPGGDPGNGDPGNGDPGKGGPVAVTGVTVTPTTGTIDVGDTISLAVSVQPAEADQSVTWSSSDMTIATVDAAGVVTGVAAGTATVTATSQADTSRSGSAEVSVVAPFVCTSYEPLPLPQFVSSSVTVESGCYDLDQFKRVQDGAVVTLEGPAEIRAVHETAGIRVESGGVLRSLGTDVGPIRFTASAAAPGSWHGVRIGSDAANELRHTTIEYAGRWANAFHLGSFNSGVRVDEGARVALEDVTIRRSQSDASRRSAGLFVQRDATVTMSGTNRFIENQGPGVHVTAAQIHMLSADDDYGAAPAANGVNVVLVNDTPSLPPTVSASRSWPALNVPYRLVRTVEVEGGGTVVTIAPGARFEAVSDAGLRVRDGAGLRAVGGDDADEQIVFTGAEPTAGAWPGLHINTANTANELRHTRIAHAGEASLSFHGGSIATAVRVGDGVNVGVGGGQNATLTFQDNEVRDSAGSGIRLEHPDTVITPEVGELAASNTFVSATIADDDIDDVR